MNGNLKKKRIFTILSILRKRDEGYRDLHDKLCKYYNQGISYSTFTKYIEKLKEKAWIYDKNQNRKRGMSSILSITDLGLDCYKYKVSIGDYDDYEKSQFLLLFLLGIGITYNLEHLDNEQKQKKIKDIQLHRYYDSLSIDDIGNDFLNNKNRLFGHLNLKKRESKKILIDQLNFLVKRGILNLTDDKRYVLYETYKKIFFKCHALMFYLINFLKFIFTYIKKPKDEYNFLIDLFGSECYDVMRTSCYNERSFKNKLTHVMKTKNKKNTSDMVIIDPYLINKVLATEFTINNYYIFYTGETLKSIITTFLDNFDKIFNKIKKDSLELLKNNYHKFIVTRIIEFIFPKFLRNGKEYIKSLNIKSEEEYLILHNSIPFSLEIKIKDPK